MPVSAKVARTAKGLTHGNHLRLPAFGVVKLTITDPGGSVSKSYLPPDSPAAKKIAPADGKDDIHFAPEKEKVKIKYKIDDALGSIRKARLELVGRFQEKPVWTRDLKPEEYTDGDHEIEWDGTVTKGDAFPEGYVTVEFSPYKMKLVVAGEVKGDPAWAWTFFHVLVAKIDLELGDKETLKFDGDRAVLKAIKDAGGLPAEDKTREVRLSSDIFQTGSAEMWDTSSFDKYKDAWANGPEIPIYAKVWIKDSTGNKVEAPKAIGNTKFLWDFEDVPEDTSRHHAKAKTFLDKALDYYKSTTHPKGDNCHKDRGGKRADDPHRVLDEHAGYAPQDDLKDKEFPFKVEKCKTRTWASYSYAWGRGKLAGKTGVILHPSRMAGDAVKATVQVAYDKAKDGSVVLDVTDDPPLNAAVHAATGGFQVWRELHFVKYVQKNATLPAFGVAKFQDYYEKANMRLVYSAGAASQMNAANYNSKLQSYVFGAAGPPAVAGQPWYMQAAIDPAVNQHATGDVAVTFRSWAAYQTALMAAQGWTAAQLATWFAGGGAALNTSAKYYGFCLGWAEDIVTKVCDQFLSASDGINLVQFQGLYNHEALPGGTQLNGFAASFPSTGRNKCAFVLCAAAGNYTGSQNTREQTVTHEIGHCLFLPHASDGVTATDISNKPDPNGHDNDWHNCTMSYNFNAERKFCGLCILRLRGWDHTKLNPTAANNKKP
jgi:hypothetical protein